MYPLIASKESFVVRWRRMWDKRIFLLLLITFQEGQRHYMAPEKYSASQLLGVDVLDFMYFWIKNRSPWRAFLVRIGLIGVPKSMPREDISKYEHTDNMAKFHDIQWECYEENLVWLSMKHHTMKVRYEGKKFARFTPFYRSLITTNGAVWVAVAGGLGFLWGIYPIAVDWIARVISLAL